MVSKHWTWLTALAVSFAGLTNAHSHVHYCFDGQEPPAAVHLVDSTDHEHEVPGHHSDDADHDDLDLDIPNQALAKACKHDSPALAAVLAWTMTFESLPRDALAESVDLPPAPDPPYARPQLRAPPR
jgi:hypothetical protein